MASKRAAMTESLYEYLWKRSGDQQPFSFNDLKAVVPSWSGPDTWRTYVSKKLKGLVEREKSQYRVKRAFRRLTLSEFARRFSQSSDTVPRWSRATYDDVVTYEFLMPLTREDKLRRALDEVFFRDTIDERTTSLEPEDLKELNAAIPRQASDTDDSYRGRVADRLAKLISGYSITHVAGRFRVGPILTRQAAANQVVTRGEPYLMDETTAVVRFIIPCPSSRTENLRRFGDVTQPRPKSADERTQVRTLFFLYFAESITSIIEGEELIWLVERSSDGERLYAWEKA